MKEKKARVEDAMHATKAAVEEGIVPGGGVALIRAAQGARRPQAASAISRSASTSSSAPSKSRSAGSRSNAGKEGSIVVQKVKDAKEVEFGYNAATETYEDLVAAGVIDPTKVVRTALQNASSIASLLLTTEALVCDIPEEKKDSGAAAWRRRRHGRHVLNRPAAAHRPLVKDRTPGWGLPCRAFSRMPGRLRNRSAGASVSGWVPTRARPPMLLLETLLQDLRYGARALLRQAGFTTVSILALALGIGVNTAVFTAYRAFVVRPLEPVTPARWSTSTAAPPV